MNCIFNIAHTGAYNTHWVHYTLNVDECGRKQIVKNGEDDGALPAPSLNVQWAITSVATQAGGPHNKSEKNVHVWVVSLRSFEAQEKAKEFKKAQGADFAVICMSL